jgi:predicted nucleotide-binding protein (sugar kinase/HSP70/actin superfamily)
MSSAACTNIRPHIKSDDLDYLHKKPSQWRDTINKKYLSNEKTKTTILYGGMSVLQDQLVESALQSLGENYVALSNPDFVSFQKGKAYGNRGQCNPTYFTVGNLVKHLEHLRDYEGLSTEKIINEYAYMTSGGCGPCRFGMYITEYRKALRDSGFEGFRVLNFNHDDGIFQEDEKENSIKLSPKFFITLVKAILIGDIINILTYKIRPYEVEKGETDKAVQKCKDIISNAFMQKKSLTLAMRRCKKVLKEVKLDRLQPKAKVMVMGEFWAAMTEGDGNYNLHRFLEEEGAECIPQPILSRLMLSIWEAKYALSKVETLEVADAKLIDFSTAKKKAMILSAKIAVKTYFKIYSKAIGLNNYEIPNMEKLADLAKDYYPVDSNGGEGHLEVAHLIESIKENQSHLVISIKPFGCMPSSGVSDGIQSLVTSRFPGSNFLPIETSGEGAVNFYSRVQMALFKAKQASKEEFEKLNTPSNIPDNIHDFTYQPKGKSAGSAAVLLESLN